MKTITLEKWRRLPKSYRSGDPRRGTAMMLYWEEGVGTVWGPVEVLREPESEQGKEER